MFVSATVYTIVPPSFGVGSSTVFTTARSTLCTVTSTESESLPGVPSA